MSETQTLPAEGAVSGSPVAKIETAARSAGKAPPIHSLTGLRFVAAFGVVLCHYSAAFHWPLFFSRLAEQGVACVSFFFILSGFVLVYNYNTWFDRDLTRYSAFLRARLARIYPMHFAALVVFTALPMCRPIFHASGSAVQDFLATYSGFAGIFSWVMTALLLHAWLHTLQWNTPSWSISAELFFYAMFPLFMFYVLRGRRTLRRLGWLLAAVFIIEWVLSLGAAIGMKYAAGHHLSFGVSLPMMRHIMAIQPWLRVWQFFFGCILGAIFLHPDRPKFAQPFSRLFGTNSGRNGVVLVCLLLFVAISELSSSHRSIEQAITWLRLFTIWTPLFGLTIFAMACGPTLITKLLEHPWMVLLGEASYSLYIIHFIPWQIILTRTQQGRPFPLWFLWTAIALTVAASLLTYRFIEIPARDLLRGRRPSR